jgi:hypothetical protein
MGEFLSYCFHDFWRFLGFIILLCIIVDFICVIFKDILDFISSFFIQKETKNYFYMGKKDGTFEEVDPNTLKPIDKE